VELHTHISDNGVKKMRRVEAVNFPSLTSVFFKTGGFHLMLMKLKFYISESDLIPLKLIFNIKENTFAFATVKEKRFFFYNFSKLRTASRD
jgi:copper(I)-binding protein